MVDVLRRSEFSSSIGLNALLRRDHPDPRLRRGHHGPLPFIIMLLDSWLGLGRPRSQSPLRTTMPVSSFPGPLPRGTRSANSSKTPVKLRTAALDLPPKSAKATPEGTNHRAIMRSLAEAPDRTRLSHRSPDDQPHRRSGGLWQQGRQPGHHRHGPWFFLSRWSRVLLLVATAQCLLRSGSSRSSSIQEAGRESWCCSMFIIMLRDLTSEVPPVPPRQIGRLQFRLSMSDPTLGGLHSARTWSRVRPSAGALQSCGLHCATW